MAQIPDPTDSLKGEARELFDRMAAVRAYAEGRSQLGDVYVAMFNNPGVATKVGALGEHLRFHATLPDEVRETVIMRFSFKQGFVYEWAHHTRPSKLAGLSQDVIDSLATGNISSIESDTIRTTVEIVDAILAKKSIPEDLQGRFVAMYGVSGLVEVVALCGLYSLMGYMTTAFAIKIEEGLPQAPF